MKRLAILTLLSLGLLSSYAKEFSMKEFDALLSLAGDVNSMQFFERLSATKIEFVETKVSVADNGHVENAMYGINPREACVFMDLEIKEYNGNTLLKSDDIHRIYSPMGIFEKDSADEEYSRLFTKHNEYPKLLNYLYPNIEYVATILSACESENLKSGDHIEAAIMFEIKDAVQSAIKRLLLEKKIDISDNPLFSMKAGLAKNNMLEYLHVKIPKINFDFKLENSFNKKYMSVADCKIFDPVNYKLKGGKYKSDYGIGLLAGRIELNRQWSKYLYKDLSEIGILNADIMKINGVDFKTLSMSKIEEIMKNSDFLNIVFQKDGKNIEYKFVKFNPIQIAVIENAEIMGIDPEIFFK